MLILPLRKLLLQVSGNSWNQVLRVSSDARVSFSWGGLRLWCEAIRILRVMLSTECLPQGEIIIVVVVFVAAAIRLVDWLGLSMMLLRRLRIQVLKCVIVIWQHWIRVWKRWIRVAAFRLRVVWLAMLFLSRDLRSMTGLLRWAACRWNCEAFSTQVEAVVRMTYHLIINYLQLGFQLNRSMCLSMQSTHQAPPAFTTFWLATTRIHSAIPKAINCTSWFLPIAFENFSRKDQLDLTLGFRCLKNEFQSSSEKTPVIYENPMKQNSRATLR